MNFRSWTIRRWITTGFGAQVFFLLVLGGLSLFSVGRVVRSNEWVQETYRVIAMASDFNAAIRAAEANQRVYLITFDERNLRAFEALQSKLLEQFSELQKAVQHPGQKQLLSATEKLLQQRLSDMTKVAELRKTRGLDAARRELTSDQNQRHAEEMNAAVAQFVAVEHTLLNDRLAAAASATGDPMIFTGTATLIALLVGAIAGWLVVRGINQRLGVSVAEVSQVADQVTAAAGQVAQANQQIAQGAGEQASSLEETSAASNEIHAMAQRNAENSRRAAEVMAEVGHSVTQANSALKHMTDSMKEIDTSGEQVSRIIRVIDEIAFQTNILALNAAVEAARAGEAGMGFAVVANEVRSLAQKCAQAARDTTKLIEASVSSARNGSVRLTEVEQVVLEITSAAERVRHMVDDVNMGSQEQTRGVEQVSIALETIEQSNQQTVMSTDQGTTASHELIAQSAKLQTIVQQLSEMVGR